MESKPIRTPLPGESVIGVHPVMAPDVDAGWRRRVNFYTGRSLSDVALAGEQASRAGRLATAGQSVSPGIIAGLEADLAFDSTDDGSERLIHVSAGYGVSISGEDISLATPMRVRYQDLPVYAPASVLAGLAGGESAGSSLGGRPISTRALGERPLGDLLERGAFLAPAGVLVLQPVVTGSSGERELTDPCAYEDGEEAFDDLQLIDGCRLVFFAWPDEWLFFPDPESYWRNALAYTIFEAERNLDPGEHLPWEYLGVPVGLIGFDFAWTPQFIDRNAVVRSGGKPRHQPLVGKAGSPFLWQARLLQFAEQLAEYTYLGLSASEMAGNVRYLPPAGLLPADAASLDPASGSGTAQFFPEQFSLSAVPVPMEQLDAVLEASAPLSPIDLAVPEQIELLVPVPQVVYEPDLLQIESVSDEFQEAIDTYVAERAEWLLRRQTVREIESTLIQAATGETPDYPDPDPDALETETVATELPEGGTPEDSYGTSLGEDGDGNQVLKADELEELRTYLNDETPLTSDEVDQLDELGVTGFIEFLQTKIDQANDRIDLNFLQVQTNIYRVRQSMLGSEAATRLATSPALAEIARGETALATSEQITAFWQLAKSKTVTEDEVTDAGTRSLAGSRSLAVEKSSASPLVASGRINEELLTETVDLVAIQKAAAPKSGLFQTKLPEQTKIIEQMPIIGDTYQPRTTTIAQRLAESPAKESKDFGVVGKYGTLVDVIDFGLNVDDLTFSGFKADGEDVTYTVAEIKENNRVAEVLAGTHDPVTGEADEAAYFSAAVKSIEDTVGILRTVEGRIKEYSQALAECESSLKTLDEQISEADARLRVIGDELAETRHDVAVARALLAEETTRVEAVNTRRASVLDEYVEILAYRRPRTQDLLAPAPERYLDPGLVEPAVPSCLAAGVVVPVELQEMIDLFRDAPVRWFAYLLPLTAQMDQISVLTSAATTAKVRAGTPSIGTVGTSVASLQGLGKAITSTYTAQAQVVASARRNALLLEPTSLSLLSWQRAQETVQDNISVGDLIDAAGSNLQIAQSAAAELSNIAQVAACLYEGFATVDAGLRLDWATRLSQHDETQNLRSLSALPGWGDLTYLERYELQSLVDWLYSRVPASVTEAVDLISDLVRVCILLASHAPVRQIVTGEVDVPTTAQVGATVQVVPTGTVRIGTPAYVYQGSTVIAQAVVKDLSGGIVATEITRQLTETTHLLEAGARVQFGGTGLSTVYITGLT